jgi:hypothetical protein
MDNHDTDSAPKRRLQKKSGASLLVPVLLLLVFLGGGYYLFFSESAQKLRPSTLADQQSREITPQAESAPSPQATVVLETEAVPVTTNHTDNQSGSDSSPAVTEQQEIDTETSKPADVQNSVDNPTGDASISAEQAACDELTDSVEEFFATLDTRDYMQAFEIGEKSNVYFPRLIQKLVDNPPVVTGETDDLFTILQNTAHFFRIIGKKNIFILKGILDRERATFEQTLADFYHLTAYPECLQERFDLTITKEPLYYYAGFFLNTMGGRLYLFRRDSMSRMVVSYYAILIIDQANREGRNKYGIDISGSVDSLIDEIESSSITLQMRDRYLDALYEMKEKYQ